MQGQAAALPRPRRRPLGGDRQPRPVRRARPTRRCACSTRSRQAVSGLFRNGGEVFAALSERQGQLRGLIRNAEHGLQTTAQRNAGPGRRRSGSSRPSCASRARRSPGSRPSPATPTRWSRRCGRRRKELAPTFTALGGLSEQLDTFFIGLRTTIDRPPKGFPALRGILDDDLPPLLGRLDPFLASLNSILEGLRLYKREVTAFFANAAAATNGALELAPGSATNRLHYMRTEAPLTPEALAVYPNRLQINRTNPYVKPGGYLDVKTALQSFETRQCSTGIVANLEPSTPVQPRLPRAHGRRRGAGAGPVRPDQAVRLQRPAQQQPIEPPPCNRRPVPVDRRDAGEEPVPARVSDALSRSATRATSACRSGFGPMQVLVAPFRPG